MIYMSYVRRDVRRFLRIGRARTYVVYRTLLYGKTGNLYGLYTVEICVRLPLGLQGVGCILRGTQLGLILIAMMMMMILRDREVEVDRGAHGSPLLAHQFSRLVSSKKKIRTPRIYYKTTFISAFDSI